MKQPLMTKQVMKQPLMTKEVMKQLYGSITNLQLDYSQ